MKALQWKEIGELRGTKIVPNYPPASGYYLVLGETDIVPRVAYFYKLGNEIDASGDWFEVAPEIIIRDCVWSALEWFLFLLAQKKSKQMSDELRNYLWDENDLWREDAHRAFIECVGGAANEGNCELMSQERFSKRETGEDVAWWCDLPPIPQSALENEESIAAISHVSTADILAAIEPHIRSVLAGSTGLGVIPPWKLDNV